MNSKEFKKIFGEIARQQGFQASPGGWLKESTESIIFLDLQKSNFGNYFELNIKIFIQGMFEQHYKKGKELQRDTGDIFRRQPVESRDIFDLDSGMDEALRKSKIKSLFEEFLVPYSNNALSIKGIKEMAIREEFFLLPNVAKELAKLNQAT